MINSDVIGWIAFFITLVYTFIGLPIQGRKNYMNKSTSGLSFFMMIVLFFTFLIWIMYGLVKSPKDWYIISSNIPGVGCVFIILCQFWVYRSK